MTPVKFASRSVSAVASVFPGKRWATRASFCVSAPRTLPGRRTSRAASSRKRHTRGPSSLFLFVMIPPRCQSYLEPEPVCCGCDTVCVSAPSENTPEKRASSRLPKGKPIAVNDKDDGRVRGHPLQTENFWGANGRHESAHLGSAKGGAGRREWLTHDPGPRIADEGRQQRICSEPLEGPLFPPGGALEDKGCPSTSSGQTGLGV